MQRSDAIESSGKDSSDEDSPEDQPEANDSEMLRHNQYHLGAGTPPPPLQQHPQKVYHYGGPPSIQMSTWQDRTIPPSQFVPAPHSGHGMVMPPASRMAAGYYSLQYSSGEMAPPPSAYLQQHEVKYSRDAVDERHRPQVCIYFVLFDG